MAYTTVDMVKDQLGITSTTHDELLELVIAAAQSAVELHTDRVWEAGDAEPRSYSPDSADSKLLMIDEAQSVSAVAEWSGDEFADLSLGDDYRCDGPGVDPAGAVAGSGPIRSLVRTSGSWCRAGHGTVKVTGVWASTASPPDDVAYATLIYACRLFQRRTAPLGITAGGMDQMPVRLSRMDPDVAALLSSRRRLAVA